MTGNNNHRSASPPDKATLDAGIDRIDRLVKELRKQDLSGIQDRWDARIEAMQKRINTVLADVLGAGTPEYKEHQVGQLESTLDTSFGDRYTSEELQDSIRKGIDGAIARLGSARKVLAGWMEQPPAGARSVAKAAAAPPPPAPPKTPAPTSAPAPAPTPAPPAAPAPAPTAAPTPPPSSAPTSSATPARTPAPSAPASQGAPMSSTASTRRVAIVNRLDDATGAVAADFVQQLGMEAVDVAAPAGAVEAGFLDRLEDVRGADYAIVLLPTADLDEAGGNPASLLEIGFLFGVLARQRVCFLLPGKPTLPPALAGLITHHAMDEAELWRLLLAREMRKAGLDVDMNRVV